MVTAPSVAKPPCKIHPTAVVADKAQLTGTHQIEIGENTIIQPYAKLHAEGGPITIASYCVVCEAAVISVPEGVTGEVAIRDYVTIGGGAQVTTALIGDHTEVGIMSIVESKASVGSVGRARWITHADVRKYCKIASKVVVQAREDLPDHTVAYGDNRRRKSTTIANSEQYREARKTTQEKQVEILRKIIPNAAAKWSVA